MAAQPGVLKALRDGDRSAATIIEGNSLYYGISPRLLLALLEATGGLLSDPAPPADLLGQPFGPSGPRGFAAQVEWASRELRAGLGPYDRPPVVAFTDGTTTTLRLDQAPEGVAVQRFLAAGRSAAEWAAAVEAFGQAFRDYFNNELVQLPAPGSAQAAPTGDFSLMRPWPAGTRVVHLAYFDHAFPTVDSGGDRNGVVIAYRGQSSVQYDGHDGHDYYFPDQPVGSPILAAAPGMAYARTHRGNGVVIQHAGGYETVYWHLDGFAPIFQGRVDTSEGIWVEAGDFIGTSGTSGFVKGTPHLHFEVRRDGKQVDPYGWYGPGPDPCLAYAGCGVSTWLWHPSLASDDGFTRPGGQVAVPLDDEPPVATLAVSPPAHLSFYAAFEVHPLQTVGRGFPIVDGELTYDEGRFGGALSTASGTLALPTEGNLAPEAGTISLWARLPESYPASATGRHYLFAASADPDDQARVYSGTLALRRDQGPDGAPRWTFWTSAGEGPASDYLSTPDSLGAGWHHFAVTWDASGAKALYIDGEQVAAAAGVALPADLGPVLQLGRFTYGGASVGADLDELAIFTRPLRPREIAGLAAGREPLSASAERVRARAIRLDINALDDGGGIMAVQLGRDGVFDLPQPYYDGFRWQLPEGEGSYEIAARFFDRAGNTTVVTRAVTLSEPPRPRVRAVGGDEETVLLALAAEDAQEPLQVQLSQRADFRDAVWRPAQADYVWRWQAGLARQLYVRFRDGVGDVSATTVVRPYSLTVYLPLAR